MKVLTEGNKYELDNFEDSNGKQILQFIEKVKVGDGAGGAQLETVSDGTTNEEVLKMLINRLQYLYDKVPSSETKDAIYYCTTALGRLESRTRDRVERKVEGTDKA